MISNFDSLSTLFRIYKLSYQIVCRKQLTHYQMTNFRFFRIERLCRRQFQIRGKWQKVIQTGRKHCGKRRNCSLRAISPFPLVFSKGLFPRGVIVWEWVKSLPNDTILGMSEFKVNADDKFGVAEIMAFVFDRVENVVGNGENAGYQVFSFSDNVFKRLLTLGL